MYCSTYLDTGHWFPETRLTWPNLRPHAPLPYCSRIAPTGYFVSLRTTVQERSSLNWVLCEIFYISKKKTTNPKTCTQTPRRKRVQVFTSCPTRYRMNLFLAYSLSFTLQPLIRKEWKRNIRQNDCHRAKILEYYTNLIPIKKKDVVSYTRYFPSSIISARNEFLHWHCEISFSISSWISSPSVICLLPLCNRAFC